MRKLIRFVLRLWSLVSLNLGRKLDIGDTKYVGSGFHPDRLHGNPNYEPWLDNAYRAALKSKPGVFLDVGANVGQTLVKVLSIDKERRYIGFEPQLDCCFYVDQFIKKNKLSGHVLLPIGLSDKSAVLTLYKQHGDVDTTASTVQGFRPDTFYSESQSICVAKGDEVLTNFGLTEVSVIKVDVEGGELEVIRGLEESIRKYKPAVFFEVLKFYRSGRHHQPSSSLGEHRISRALELEQALRKHGFRIYNVSSNGELAEVDQISPVCSADEGLTDYVAVHGEHVVEFFRIFES